MLSGLVKHANTAGIPCMSNRIAHLEETVKQYDYCNCTCLHDPQANINGSAHSSPDMYCIPPSDERDILYTLEKLNVTKIPRDSIQ